MDGLTAAYFVAFVGGAGFSIISWLLGTLGSHGDAGGGHGAHGANGGAVTDAMADGSAEGTGGHDVAHGPAATHGHALAHGHEQTLAHGQSHAHAHGQSHAHGHGQSPAHGHGQSPAHGHGHQAVAAKVVAPLLNLSSLAALSCIGGGAGLIARRAGAGAPLSFLIAIPSGLAAAYLIGSLIAWLKRESRFKEPTQLGGTLATVLAPVSSEHLGEVMYLNDGVRATLPARGAKSTVLEPGTEVVILDVKDGIARVGAAAELLGIEAAPAARTQRQLPHGEKERSK
jgi:hypothetical protein